MKGALYLIGFLIITINLSGCYTVLEHSYSDETIYYEPVSPPPPVIIIEPVILIPSPAPPVHPPVKRPVYKQPPVIKKHKESTHGRRDELRNHGGRNDNGRNSGIVHNSKNPGKDNSTRKRQ